MLSYSNIIAFAAAVETEGPYWLLSIFHLNTRIFSRSRGQSSTAAAAYRSSSIIKDQKQGKTFDYSKKKGTVYSTILTPADVPAWANDRAMLWNAIELTEKHCKAQVCREIEVSLPCNLSVDQNIELVTNYIQGTFVATNMIADVSIHEKTTDDSNAVEGNYYHAHILLTLREVSSTGFGKKNREWNSKKQHQKWREKWQEYANNALALAKCDERIDHRTLDAQKMEALLHRDFIKAKELDRKPEPKIGVAALALHRKGIPSTRHQAWVNIRKFNMRKSLGQLKRRLTSKKAPSQLLQERLTSLRKSKKRTGHTNER